MPYDIHKLDKKLPEVLLVYGEENFLVDELVQKVLNSAIEKGIDENSHERLDGSALDEKDIVDNANNLSLISPQKLLLVRNFDVMYKNKRKSFPGFVNYLKKPNPDTSLLLIGAPKRMSGLSKDLNNPKKKSAAEKKVDKLPEALKFIIKNDLYVEFPRIYDNQIPDWIVDRVNQRGKEIDLRSANLISASSNNSLREIDNEITKLFVYVGDRKNISLNDVETVIGLNRENNVYELTKSVGKKDVKTSFRILENLMSVSDKSVLILITLNRYFVTLFKLYEERKKTTNKFQLAGKIGVNPYFVDEYISALRNFHPKEYEKIFNELAKADEELKSTSTDHKYLMTRTLLSILGK